MQEFSRQIKNCRLFCKLNENKLQLALLNFEEDQLYQRQFENTTLPPTITKLVTNTQDLYDFLKEKVRYFKITGPGQLIGYRYTGTAEKYISFELERQQLTANKQAMRYIGYLKRQLNKMCASEKQQMKLIKGQKSKQQLLQAQIARLKQPENRNGRRSKVYSQQNGQQTRESDRFLPKQRKSAIVTVTSLSNRNKRKQSEKIKNEDMGEKCHFEVNQSCRFYNKFRINSNQIQKIISTESYQLYSKQPLKKTKSYFSCLLTKLKYGNLIAGIIIQNLVTNKESSCSVGCVCFDNYYGAVMNNGVQDPTQYTKLKDGDILTVAIDLQQKKVEWHNRTTLIAQVDLPPNMLNYKLFPYFQLFDKDDSICLNQQA